MLETCQQHFIMTMANKLNLLRTLRQDSVVLSDCLYTLDIDQWNQMRLAVAKNSFPFPCNVNLPIIF